jgi:hypothetical protein
MFVRHSGLLRQTTAIFEFLNLNKKTANKKVCAGADVKQNKYEKENKIISNDAYCCYNNAFV